MPSYVFSGSVTTVKPETSLNSTTKPLRVPTGVVEARRKLNGLHALGQAGQGKRLLQAAYDLSCALVWAEKAARELPPAQGDWLANACEALRLAERQLAALGYQHDSRVDRDAGLRLVGELLNRVAECYRQASETSPYAPTGRREKVYSPSSLANADNTAFEVFREYVEIRGLRPALAYVVELTEFRHIGLWNFEGCSPSPYAYYDRENPDAVEPLPADDCSGCCYIKTRSGVSMLDALLQVTGKKSSTSQRYLSEPIITKSGDVVATLCMHDARPGLSLGENAALVAQVRDYFVQTWPGPLTGPNH